MEKEQFTILIIDDDPDRNSMLRRQLTNMDFFVISAYSGVEGIQITRDQQPDIVILDVKLPDINGFEVLQMIKSWESTKNCFVIMISSVLISSEDQSTGFESGADGYLVFPLSNREFSARILAFVRHKQTIDALTDSELRLKTVLENTSDGMLLLDYEGKIMFANNTAQRLFHRKSDGMNDLMFGLPIVGSGKTIIDIPAEGNLITAEIEVMETGSGKQKVSIVTLRDVTEHRRLAEKMTSQIDHLLNNEQHQDKLFSMIAHDLRSPFNVLLNLTESLIEEHQGMSQDEMIKHLSIIYHSSQKVFNLLVNLLDWSRIKTGSWKQFPQLTNINSVVNEVFTIFVEMAVRKDITLINKVLSSTQLLIDLNILQAILRNLISNAIKFTSPGGYVTVNAEVEPTQLKLWVEDNGSGMSEEKLNNLFDRDHMGEKSHPDSGTGLGLYLCKELVEISGGKLEITSTPSKGTKVCCVFHK